MDWYEEPINPECAPKPPEATFRRRFVVELAAKIMATARAETDKAFGLPPTDFYIQRFMRKD